MFITMDENEQQTSNKFKDSFYVLYFIKEIQFILVFILLSELPFDIISFFENQKLSTGDALLTVICPSCS